MQTTLHVGIYSAVREAIPTSSTDASICLTDSNVLLELSVEAYVVCYDSSNVQLVAWRNGHRHCCWSAGIKLATFDTAKSALTRAHTAYDEELMQWQRTSINHKSSSGLV